MVETGTKDTWLKRKGEYVHNILQKFQLVYFFFVELMQFYI